MDEPCVFCDVGSGRSRRFEHFIGAVDDEVMLREANALLVPDIAPIVAGHLLAVSHRHAASSVELQADEFEALNRILIAATNFIRTTFTRDAMTFEHGGWLASENLAGPCIDHCHVHILPADESTFESVSRLVGVTLGPSQSGPPHESNFVSIAFRSTQHFWPMQNPRSQFLRQTITQVVNEPHRASWIAGLGGDQLGISKARIKQVRDAWMSFASANRL